MKQVLFITNYLITKDINFFDGIENVFQNNVFYHIKIYRNERQKRSTIQKTDSNEKKMKYSNLLKSNFNRRFTL